MSPIPNVLLDLDGTLTDPAPGFVASIQHALVTLGVTPPADSQIASYIGPPIEETLGTLLGPAAATRLQDAVRLYRERYSTRGLFENSVYQGIPESLAAIQGSGARIFLVTSKPEVFAVRILEHFGLSRFFTHIHGSHLDGSLADKRELLAHVLRTEAIDPATAIMVGDRLHDIRAARVNGVRSLGVLWGYGSASELTEAGADHLLSTPAELPSAVLS